MPAAANDPAEPINDVEVCVVACKRSGHHAVINWIAEQFPGTPFQVNNCKTGENPFTENRRSLEKRGRQREADVLRREENGPLTRKPLLIYNFEDCDLRAVFAPAEKERRARHFGPSRARHNVLVLRDHYNLFASRVRRVRVGSPSRRERLDNALGPRGLYVQHARECLDETRHIDENRVVILYNRWFCDEQYRREISAQLGGTYREDTLGRVATYGEGSSFDGVTYEARAREMNVLERWRAFAGNHFFNSIVGGREMRRCTARLFPEVDYPAPSLMSRGLGWLARGLFRVLDLTVRALRRVGLFT